MTKVHYSALEDKFWINDGADGVLWFSSSLDAKDAAHQIELDAAAQAEAQRIVAWLRALGQGGHFDDIYEEIAADIEAGAHRK